MIWRTARCASAGCAPARRGYSACDTALPTSVAGAFRYRKPSPQKPAAACPENATSMATANASCKAPRKACGVLSKGKSRNFTATCRIACRMPGWARAGNRARHPPAGAGCTSTSIASTPEITGAMTSAQAASAPAGGRAAPHNATPSATCNRAAPPYCSTRLMASARKRCARLLHMMSSCSAPAAATANGSSHGSGKCPVMFSRAANGTLSTSTSRPMRTHSASNTAASSSSRAIGKANS